MKTTLTLLFILSINFCAHSINAQSGEPSEEQRNNCSGIAKSSKKVESKIITLGVLNGRAVTLVKPNYPVSASMVNVRGPVHVAVMIDENGCVYQAKAVSGNPSLIPASLKAAKSSTFEPVQVGGSPIKVSGVITYSYFSGRMNWLELGYFSDTFDTFRDNLPARFDVEARLLEQSNDLDLVGKKAALDDVLKRIRSSLASEEKHLWLFNVGQQIKVLSVSGRQVEDLQLLADQNPPEVSLQLKIRVNELIQERDPTRFQDRVRSLTQRLFDLGN